MGLGLHDRRLYVCLPCRFTSKYSGRCGSCGGTLRAFYNTPAPRKHDDRGWKKLEILLDAHDSGLLLCRCYTECVPLGIRWPRNKKDRKKKLTLNQLKARIRKQREHPWEQRVPQYHGM